MGLTAPSREPGCLATTTSQPPGGSQEAGSLPVNIQQLQRSQAARDAGGKGLLRVLPRQQEPPPSSHTRNPEPAAPCKAWGKESTVLEMTLAHGAERGISPWSSPFKC